MCGIVGCIGNVNSLDVRSILIGGLEKLEYRGYDSAGIATIENNRLQVVKIKGKIKDLNRKLSSRKFSGKIGIAHTRWATHGEPSERNAHPHTDCTGKIALVHNGIIENYRSLRGLLKDEGHIFKSDTDTEVLCHLIEKFYKGDITEAVEKALTIVEGAYAIAVICQDEPEKLVVARFGSPMVVGICGKGKYIAASDATAIIEHTRDVVYLNDRETAELSPYGYKIMPTRDVKIERITWSLEKVQKGGYPHFMLKEIYEQPETICDAMRGRLLEDRSKLGGLETRIESTKSTAIEELLRTKKLVIVACGTSWHAGLIGEYVIENISNLPVEVEYASEARYRNFIIDNSTAVLAISQSGETADTLAAIREARKRGAATLGLVNVVGSTIARETDAGVYLHAGFEIGVASTKAFTSQITVLALITLLLGRRKGIISKKRGEEIVGAMRKLPEQVKEILKDDKYIKEIAQEYKDFKNFIYLGRGYNFPVALEGALKLKEISYIHAEGYPAAEMKHGPIALIDENMPCVVIATNTRDKIYEKVISNIEEIKARKGTVIAVATQGNKKIKELVNYVIYVPKTEDFLTPILTVIPLQLLAYHAAVLKGLDVDKPRNLAKSVTVE